MPNPLTISIQRSLKYRLDVYTLIWYRLNWVGRVYLIFTYSSVSVCSITLPPTCWKRVTIKFLAKLNKTAAESHRILSEVYRELVFLNGINGFVMEERTLIAQTVLSQLKRTKTLNKIIRQDRRPSIGNIPEMLSLDRESLRRILTENINMRKVRAKMIPKIQTTKSVEKWIGVLRQGNAPAHSALTIQHFLTDKQISILQHPP